nr:GATA zinc finger domain-containing protein 7-like [Ipomoea batatas]
MDSGNSGSLQSSSGGDEEYDSRGESISNFLNQSGQFDSIISSSSSPQPQFLFQSSGNPDATFPQSLANLNSQYGNNHNHNHNNHDLVWPGRGLRSEPGFGNFGGLVGAAPGSSATQGGMIGGESHHGQFSSSSSLPTVQVAAVDIRGPSDGVVVPKNPKKRTRASRRAPTTVLTTDTANFRQMVQEFTGIPTAPFSVGAPYSRRLDLFSAAGSAIRSPHLDSLGPLYPLRPSAQKVQNSPFLNTTMLDALMAANNTRCSGGNTAAAAGGAPNSSNLNLGNTDLGITKQGPNLLLNMQNHQILPFHPLLQSSIKNNNPLGNTNALEFGTKSSMDDALGIINNDPNLGFPTQQGINDGGGNQMRLFDGNNGNNNSYKQNCSTSSTSEFHPEKGLENVP